MGQPDEYVAATQIQSSRSAEQAGGLSHARPTGARHLRRQSKVVAQTGQSVFSSVPAGPLGSQDAGIDRVHRRFRDLRRQERAGGGVVGGQADQGVQAALQRDVQGRQTVLDGEGADERDVPAFQVRAAEEGRRGAIFRTVRARGIGAAGDAMDSQEVRRPGAGYRCAQGKGPEVFQLISSRFRSRTCRATSTCAGSNWRAIFSTGRTKRPSPNSNRRCSRPHRKCSSRKPLSCAMWLPVSTKWRARRGNASSPVISPRQSTRRPRWRNYNRS